MKVKNPEVTSCQHNSEKRPEELIGDQCETICHPDNLRFDLPLSARSQVMSIMNEYDLRNISPIQMAELCNALYKEGILEFDDFVAISFQPELNPEQYLMTHGKYPNPVAPKNIIEQYQSQLEIEIKCGSSSSSLAKLRRAINIFESLHSLSHPGKE